MNLSASCDTSLSDYLLRLGDNALILSQQLCGWCGHAPTLEEDVALSNIALDLLGQARLWLEHAGASMVPVRDEDDLAYHRDAHQFTHVLLVEQPNGNFADTQVRQFLFDSWHCLLLTELSRSTEPRISAIAIKARKEATYHLQHSSQWIVRLGDGTERSHRYAQRALEQCVDYVGELFAMDAVDHEMVRLGIGADLAALRPQWQAYVEQVLAAGNLVYPASALSVQGGRHGQHSELLVGLLMEMQHLARSYPGAQW